MKTRFKDQREVAHVWAQQNHQSGKCNGALYFEGRTIYSYGTHFPCATFINSETVLINSDSYSVSTSKQQGYVKSAITHKKKIYCSTAVIKWFLWDGSFNNTAQNTAVKECENAVQRFIVDAGRRKAAKYKAADIVKAQQKVNECKTLFDAFNTPYPEKLISLADMLNTDDFNSIIAADNERRAKLALAARQKQEAIQLTLRLDIEKNWIHGKPLECDFNIFNSDKIYMRIEENEIVTTKGAMFPIDHAKKAFKIIRMVREGALKTMTDKEHVLRLGHYSIDHIDAQGNVKAGCHNVSWDEIERLARILDIYP